MQATTAIHRIPILLGTCSFGLRSAFDGGHIPAVDAITRRSTAEERRPNSADFFSLGRPSVAVALADSAARSATRSWRRSW